MWTESDFLDAIQLISVADNKESVIAINNMLKKECLGEDKKTLWRKLNDVQRFILSKPDLLPSHFEEIEHKVAA